MREVHRAVGRPLGLIKPAARRSFAARQGLTILGWHRIGASNNGLTTSERDFRQQVEYLRSIEANVLPLSEAVEGLSSGVLPTKAIALTFDDGYSSVTEKAWPILKAAGFPATLFVVPEYMNDESIFPWDDETDEARLMTSAQVLAASRDGLDIQSHSLRHRWLPGGSATQILEDLSRSRSLLQELLGRDINGLAYPTGGWNRTVRRMAAEAGYDYAITVDRGLNPLQCKHVHSLRRAFVPDDVDDLGLLLDGTFDYLMLLERARRRIRNRRSRRLPW